MPEPNPLWGVHVVAGAVTAVLVRRADDGRYEVLEAIAERAPEDPVQALATARSILSRRGVGARGAMVALPDANGCLVTATIPPEELDLSEHEISNEMYEWTPFEPDQAELRHLCVLREGRRQERFVAAIPRADYRRFLEVLQRGDTSRLGVAFAGACSWRGARAMGLVADDGFLVCTLPRVTEVYAARGQRVRRHLLAIGETDLLRDATAVDLLADDLARLADYERALRRSAERPRGEPTFTPAGLSATSAAVRQGLASVLGPRLAEAGGESAVSVAPSARMPAVPLAALAGAVGAALEGLRSGAERLVLRHVPSDVPPYRDRRPAALAAAGVLALVAGAVVLHTVSRETGPAPDAPSGARPRAAETAAAPAPTEPPRQPSSAPTESSREEPVPTPALHASVEAPGRVRIRWPAGAEERVLRRQFRGDGSGPADQPMVDVRSVGDASGECIDEVPGPAGLYAWTLDGAEPVTAYVEVRVSLELAGPGADGGARFVLRRAWGEGTASVTVEAAPGARIEGSDGSLVFDSGWRLDAVRTRTESERAAVRVPRFLPDGRVQRGPDDAAQTVERVLERERRVFEADGVADGGARRTWRLEK